VSTSSEWWPEPLRDIPMEDPLSSEYVVAAEITEPWVAGSYRKLCTALVPVDRIEAVLSRVGGIGYEVSTNGPYPTPVGDSPFEPRFYVWAGEVDLDGLEPLVVAWEQYNRTMLLPDQGFLMTYGLTPRYMQLYGGDVSFSAASLRTTVHSPRKLRRSSGTTIPGRRNGQGVR
jgi:hypothetical protein